MRTYTELKFYPNNANPIARMGIIQGDHNIISPIMGGYIKGLERKKESYCYEVLEPDGSIKFLYSLKDSEFKAFKKHLPNFN